MSPVEAIALAAAGMAFILAAGLLVRLINNRRTSYTADRAVVPNNLLDRQEPVI